MTDFVGLIVINYDTPLRKITEYSTLVLKGCEYLDATFGIWVLEVLVVCIDEIPVSGW